MQLQFDVALRRTMHIDNKILFLSSVFLICESIYFYVAKTYS